MNKRIDLIDVFPLIEEQLSAGGSATFTVHGTSMQPLLYDRRDSVTVTRYDSLARYDIIFYRRRDGSFILHRIVGFKDGFIVCRGDNQTESEYPVYPELVIGAVCEYTRKGKRKSVNSFSFKAFSLFWVNTVFVRRVYRKIASVFKGRKK